MDIRMYNTKDLPYRFVLFCNIPKEKLFVYSMGMLVLPGENSLLTYCYIDQMAGITYEVVCKAALAGDGSIEYGEINKTASMKIREGSLVGEALVFPEGYEMARFQEVAEKIKSGYGYHIEMIKKLESKRFSHKRHVCYPEDIMVLLYDVGNKPEEIWVTEIKEETYPPHIKRLVGTKINQLDVEIKFVGAGKLINQPYSSLFGYKEGDIAPIFAFPQKNGLEEPVVFGISTIEKLGLN